jgi:hypothetical protein
MPLSQLCATVKLAAAATVMSQDDCQYVLNILIILTGVDYYID